MAGRRFEAARAECSANMFFCFRLETWRIGFFSFFVSPALSLAPLACSVAASSLRISRGISSTCSSLPSRREKRLKTRATSAGRGTRIVAIEAQESVSAVGCRLDFNFSPFELFLFSPSALDASCGALFLRYFLPSRCSLARIADSELTEEKKKSKESFSEKRPQLRDG